MDSASYYDKLNTFTYNCEAEVSRDSHIEAETK